MSNTSAVTSIHQGRWAIRIEDDTVCAGRDVTVL